MGRQQPAFCRSACALVFTCGGALGYLLANSLKDSRPHPSVPSVAATWQAGGGFPAPWRCDIGLVALRNAPAAERCCRARTGDSPANTAHCPRADRRETAAGNLRRRLRPPVIALQQIAVGRLIELFGAASPSGAPALGKGAAAAIAPPTGGATMGVNTVVRPERWSVAPWHVQPDVCLYLHSSTGGRGRRS